MNGFPLKPFQWVNHGISKVSVIYPLVLVSFRLKIQWVVPWVFNGTASHSVKTAVVDLVDRPGHPMLSLHKDQYVLLLSFSTNADGC